MRRKNIILVSYSVIFHSQQSKEHIIKEKSAINIRETPANGKLTCSANQ